MGRWQPDARGRLEQAALAERKARKPDRVLGDEDRANQLALALVRQKLGDRPVTGLIYTHSHADHVFGIVAANGGSISAEHGIGRAKSAWTHLGRDATDLATMRAIKDALDPRGTLNPGVIFP